MREHTELSHPEHPVFAYYSTPDLHSDLAAAIQSLPVKYRDAIILRDLEEFSVAEMAMTLRLTREAVKSRIHRGRQMAREYLHD